MSESTHITSITAATPHIQLQMLSDPMLLSGAREMVLWVARRSGFNELDCSQIALAVDEALCNVFRHGYDRHTDGMIWMSIWPRPATDAAPGSIKIVIEDEARQVDPEGIKSRDLDDIRPGGLGVHIIKEVMDEVVYERRPRRGMRLTMEKTISPPATNVATDGTTAPASDLGNVGGAA